MHEGIVLAAFVTVLVVCITTIHSALNQMGKILSAYRKASRQWCSTTNKLAQGGHMILALAQSMITICCLVLTHGLFLFFTLNFQLGNGAENEQ
jgi:flagellar biosynthesis protein FlhB